MVVICEWNSAAGQQTVDRNKVCQQNQISLTCCDLFTASQCQLMFESFSFTSPISESSWSWSLLMQLAKLLKWQKEEWILIFTMKDLEVCCILITTLLMIFQRFLKILQNLSIGVMNVAKHFPKIFKDYQRLVKILEVNWRLLKTFEDNLKMFQSYTSEY